MNRSGIKRGLAYTAVSALALSGLALTAPAQAQTVGDGQVAFELYSQAFNASTAFDGANNTVTLFAGVPDGAGISEVRFSYLKGATQVEISEIAPNNGIATIEWTPPAGAEGAAITGVRAEALDAAEAVLATQDAAVEPNNAAGMQNNGALQLAGALRSRVGLGPDGEVIVSGTSNSSNPGTNQLQNVGPAGDGAAVNPVEVGAPDGQNVSQIKAVVPIDPSNDTGDAEDEIIIRGLAVSVGGPSDDVNAYTMYNQVVTNASIASAPGFPANVQLGGADDESRFLITVVDQEGQPVQGLDVFEVENAAAGAPADGSGNAQPDTGETDVNGQATVSLFESTIDNGQDNDGVPNQQRAFYVVDVNQDGNYDDGVDYRFALVQTGITPVATTVTITSSKGLVLDDDETTNLVATVLDQNGQPIANKSTVISATLTCTGPNPDFVVDQPPAAGLTDANGQLVFANVGDFGGIYPQCEDGQYTVTVDAFANNNGTPQPDAGDAIAPQLVLDYDVTTIEWDSGSVAQAENGTTTTQTGRLVQVDGDALGADRVIAIDYNPTDNSEIADAQTAPTQKVNDLTATSETNAQGAFTVAVTDPAAPDGQELDSELTAEAPGLEEPGDQTDATLEIDFLRSIAPAVVRIINPLTGTQADGLQPGLANPDGALIPGGLGIGELEVENADGVALTDVDIDLTVDEGFFVDVSNGNLAFEPTPAPGAPVDFASAGQSITVSTGDGVSTLFAVNIERNEGFDDDGLVDDGLRATAGAATDVHDFTWTTNATPLNPRATNPLVVELSDDQESSILPQARAGDPAGSGQVVDYDVDTYDQFGNRTSQDITVSDNTPVADFSTGGVSEFDLTQPAVSAFAAQATTQVLEVELDGSVTNTYADDVNDSSFDPANPGGSLNQAAIQVEEETDAINWYDLDVENSTFALSQQGAQNVPVGTTVTMVFTARDQEGQPIQGMFVDFLRAGPGNEDDDSCNEDVLNSCQQTDANGQAFLDFAGGSAGTANVSVIGYEDDGTRIGTLATDTVTFGGTPPNPNPGGREEINPAIKAKSQGAKDILTVRAKKADGAKVTLFRIVNDRRVRIATGTLNSNGVKRFAVRDTNRRRLTTYQAVVAPTSDTKRGVTQRRLVR